MILKDIVKNAACLLNREHVVKFIDGECEQNLDAKEQTDVFVFCANLVVNELASSFFAMKKIEKVNANNGQIEYSVFAERPLEILSVENERGEQIPFKERGNHLELKGNAVFVTYKYLPPNYNLSDTIGFSDNRISARILAYGVVAEVCLIERAFSESVSFRKRYSEEISKLILPKSKCVKARRWA